jgi:hypothetical protein
MLSFLVSGCVAGQGQIDASSPAHVREALKYNGQRNPTGFAGKWCMAFTLMILRDTGHHPRTNSLLAADAVQLGSRINSPIPGALFVQPHHVGIVIKPLGNDEFLAVSGNNGHRVQVSTYRNSGIKFVIPE